LIARFFNVPRHGNGVVPPVALAQTWHEAL